MRFSVHVPNFAEYADPRTLAELAYEAEQAGWEGFFLWDHILFFADGSRPLADPWVALAAIAMRTERMRIGALVTPVPRRRPWVLARQTASLDHLSGGRLVFGAGLGWPPDAEYEVFGEESDARVRAAKLDEGLEVMAGLWSGRPFSFAGEQFRLSETTFSPAPLQTPRIPVWIGATWPNKRPFRRAARWDGIVPESATPSGMDGILTPDEVRAAVAYVREHRSDAAPFDVVIGAFTASPRDAESNERVAQYAEAGVTWWMERIHPWRGSFDEMRKRIREGPPEAAG